MLPTQSTLSLARDTQPQGHWESRNCLHFASTQLSLLPPKPIWPRILLAPFLSVASLFLLLYSVCFSGEHLLFPVEPQERKAEESRVATVPPSAPWVVWSNGGDQRHWGLQGMGSQCPLLHYATWISGGKTRTQLAGVEEGEGAQAWKVSAGRSECTECLWCRWVEPCLCWGRS